MKCLFIYNPVSGKGLIKNNLTYIRQTLAKKYKTVEVYETKSRGDMTSKAKSACGFYDAIIFSGGDGSFNEIIQGIAAEENRPTLGYIPAGTVNDIAHSLKIPTKLSKALNNILYGEPQAFDVIKANDRYAFYVICAGAFTGCSYLAGQDMKKKLGKTAYVFEVLKNEMKLRDFAVEMTTDSEVIKANCEFIIAFNSRRVASRPINLKAELSDGLIDLLLVKQVEKPKSVHKFNAFFKIVTFFIWGYNAVTGKNNELRKSDYTSFCGSHFGIKADDSVCWNFDGEEGPCGPLNIDVLKQHVSVIVPKKGKK